REPARFLAIGGTERRIRHAAPYPKQPLKRAARLTLLDPNFQASNPEREGPAAALASVPGAFRNWESRLTHAYLLGSAGWRPAEHRQWDRMLGGAARQRPSASWADPQFGTGVSGRDAQLAACRRPRTDGGSPLGSL